MRPIYPYAKAREMYNTTNGAGFKDSPATTKAFLRQPMYDTLVVSAAAGLQTLSFFTTLGNIFKTNMSLAGQFPNGQDFLVWNIQPYFTPGVLNSAAATQNAGAPTTVTRSQYVNDVAAFWDNAVLEINILSAPWLRAPLKMLPPANRLVGAAAVSMTDADATAVAAIAETDIASWGGEVFDVNGLWIPSSTNIEILVSLNLAAGLPSGVDGSLQMNMDGVLYRNTQ